MTAWPSTLPTAIVLSGYGISPADQTLRTDMEVGAARTRQRSFDREDLVDVQFNMTDAELAIFRAFFDDDIGHGAGWFSIDLAVGNGGVETVDARFKGTWKATLVPGMAWTITATLEIN